jgi:ankyrin repeat protein
VYWGDREVVELLLENGAVDQSNNEYSSTDSDVVDD